MLKLLTSLTRRTRQHHAIEHATLHLLAARHPDRRMLGVSDPFGFTIVGAPDLDAVRRAVSDAMLRLNAGESHLAIHPNCGTNLAVTSFVVTALALAGFKGRGGFVDRFGRAMLLVVVGLVVAPPLGQRAQRYTTLADVSDCWLNDVVGVEIGRGSFCRVAME
jgi:hypothetical protein